MIIALKGTVLFPKAFAHSDGIHKIAICDAEYGYCAFVNRDVTHSFGGFHLEIRNMVLD